MPGPEHGLKRAILDLSIGFAISAIVVQISGESEGVISLLLSLGSIILMIEMFSKMNHWSLGYLMGYIFGLSLFGPHLLSTWEFMVSLIAGFTYLIIKGSRKIRSGF